MREPPLGDSTAKQLMEQMAALKKVTDRLVRKQEGADTDSDEEDKEPCARHILDAVLPKGFKMPSLAAYTGSTDPRDHLSRYNRLMTVAHVSDDGKCLCFSITMGGPAEE